MSKLPIPIEEIIDMLPHRYPLLLVDRVVELPTEDSLVAIKNVTFNENFFMGHFPGRPVMPGVLIVEALAQASCIYVVHTLGDEARGKLVYFMSIENAKFRKPVVPGDTLYLHTEKLQNHGKVWKFKTEGRVEGKKVVEATLVAMIVDDGEKA